MHREEAAAKALQEVEAKGKKLAAEVEQLKPLRAADAEKVLKEAQGEQWPPRWVHWCGRRRSICKNCRSWKGRRSAASADRS